MTDGSQVRDKQKRHAWRQIWERVQIHVALLLVINVEKNLMFVLYLFAKLFFSTQFSLFIKKQERTMATMIFILNQKGKKLTEKNRGLYFECTFLFIRYPIFRSSEEIYVAGHFP